MQSQNRRVLHSNCYSIFSHQNGFHFKRQKSRYKCKTTRKNICNLNSQIAEYLLYLFYKI